MNRRYFKPQGFSLMEMMISLTIMLFVIIAILSLVVSEQNTHLTEGRKLDMNQGARVIEQMFTEGFRSAGSVLSMANTPTLLGTTNIPFNGVYPLNNSDYPDGIILASGDPMALTRLTQSFNSGAGGETVNVQSVDRADGSGVAWHNGDYGLIMRSDGYYVFRVSTVNAASLSVRATPAYYSGLLNTAHYDDKSNEAWQLGTMGTGLYPSDSPVIRLEYFNIFLVRTEADKTKTLTLSVDCDNEPDVLAHPTDTRAVPILPNIEDIQIEYIAKVVPTDIWAGSDTAFPGGTANFYNQFYNKNIASARIFVLLRTEEERNIHKGSGIIYSKPAMGDVAAVKLPVGRYHYTYMQYEVLLRNYNL